MGHEATNNAATSECVYEAIDLERSFRVGSNIVKAVDGVSFTVKRGEFVAIEGASGSGKSTLLQLLGGLDRATAGSLALNGKQLAKLTDRELTSVRLHDIGFVFQQFNLIPTLSAVENVESAMAPTKLTPKQRQERAQTLLRQVGLANRCSHVPSLLSGGEQQRVAICRALTNNPSVILADEPTGNLDSQTSIEVVETLGSLSQDLGVTVILVTHERDVAKRAQRRLIMNDGKLSDTSNP